PGHVARLLGLAHGELQIDLERGEHFLVGGAQRVLADHGLHLVAHEHALGAVEPDQRLDIACLQRGGVGVMIFWKSLTVSAAALPATAATPAASSMVRRAMSAFIKVPPGEAPR